MNELEQILNTQGDQFDDENAPSLAKRLLWICNNERHAPELLPYPFSVVSEVIQSIKEQNDAIEQLTVAGEKEAAEAAADIAFGNDAARPALLPFRAEQIYRLEVGRLQYILSDLIRIRARKLERLASNSIKPPEGCVSDNEQTLYSKLVSLTKRALHIGAMGIVNDPAPPPGESDEHLRLRQYVFVTALETVKVQLPGVDTDKELFPGDIWICRYVAIRDHITSGKMRLV